MADRYRRIAQNHNGPKPKPTLGELVESSRKAVQTMQTRTDYKYSEQAINDQVRMVRMYEALAAEFGADTKYSKVPAGAVSTALKAVEVAA